MWVDIKGEVHDYEKGKVNIGLHIRYRYVEEMLPCMPMNSI